MKLAGLADFTSQTFPSIFTSYVPFNSVLPTFNFTGSCNFSMFTPAPRITAIAADSIKSPIKNFIIVLYSISPLVPFFSNCCWHKGFPNPDILIFHSDFLLNCFSSALPHDSLNSFIISGESVTFPPTAS